MTAKPLEEFYLRAESGLRRRECKDCIIIAQRQRLLGVTEHQYQEMFAAQGGECAICKRSIRSLKKSRLSVDHDHKTGAIRGLLCGSCNTAIGLLRDSPEHLESAKQYLLTKR